MTDAILIIVLVAGLAIVFVIANRARKDRRNADGGGCGGGSSYSDSDGAGCGGGCGGGD